jgi:hypothetical protein
MRFFQLIMALTIALASTTASAEIPTQSDAESKIRAKCKADFATDFSTQAYCIQKNKEGYAKFLNLYRNVNHSLKPAYDKCQSDFGSEGDWSTAAYCANRQLQAFRELNR